MAPVVSLPALSSLAITDVVDVLAAAGVPAILLGPDREMRFVSTAAVKLFESRDLTVGRVEDAIGVGVGDLSAAVSMPVRVRDRHLVFSLVPISGGAGGAALIFRYEEPTPTVSEVVRRVGERFATEAERKGINLEIDAHEIDKRFSDHEDLSEVIAILVENALHYTPENGQVVIGVRELEHKGIRLLLFYVMDTGPLVPENLRQEIFEPLFSWDEDSAERTGRNLFKARQLAARHGGLAWVESKTGKACTFFLRVQEA